jgi:hypothetical protein
LHCGEKVRRPCIECSAFLLCPIVLINPDYASSALAQMVQHRLGDFQAHAEALQPCREGPAQVMRPSAVNTGCGVKRWLCFDQPLKGVPRRRRRVPASRAGARTGRPGGRADARMLIDGRWDREVGNLARAGNYRAIPLHAPARRQKSRTCLNIDLWTRSAAYFQVLGK